MATVHQVGGVPQTKTLRVLPRGTALVPNYEANPGKTFVSRVFHGWRHDASMGGEVLEPVRTTWEPSGKRQGAFVRVPDEVTTVPDTAEYRRHLRGDERRSEWHGDLWPADEETARAVGIPFDPTFGGEHPECAKRFAKPSADPGTRVPIPAPTAPETPAAKETAK